MKTNNTFGVHFILRRIREGQGTVYARISVNSTRTELGLKEKISVSDWNTAKGSARPKNQDLKRLNSFLEEIRAKLAGHYRELILAGGNPPQADQVKLGFLGIGEMEEKHSLLWLCAEHNKVMTQVLKKGSMKNYFTTERYIKAFLENSLLQKDVGLDALKADFITRLEFYIRTSPLKEHDACTNNGAMKHMERFKKMINWAVQNSWLKKNPFDHFKLKYRRTEREFLREEELERIMIHAFAPGIITRTRDIFVFSCYTGLSFADASVLRQCDIHTATNGTLWVATTREKTGTPVNVPILSTGLQILKIYTPVSGIQPSGNIFPKITNQEVNRNLKIIAEVCGINKNLTFHLARHTFATTVTLMNGVPIESISKMLGHTKIATTMIYAKVCQDKIGADMSILQQKMDNKKVLAG